MPSIHRHPTDWERQQNGPFFFCGGESTSLFSLRKTLKAFIAILPLLQNLEGLEKDSSLFLEKLCTCHNTTIAFASGAAS